MISNPWLENVFRPLILGAMVGSVAWSLAALLALLVPGLDITLLVVFCTLIAVESYFSHRFLAGLRWDTPAKMRYRVSEFVLMLLVLQLGLAVAEGSIDFLTRIRSLTDNTLVAAILVLICWGLGTATTIDLERIGEPPEQVYGYVTPLEALTNRFFMVGALLLLFTGLTRVALADLLNLERPAVPGLVLNVLIYFALGILLLGQVRYAGLRQQWEVRDLRVNPGISASWVRYSLIFALVVLLLAFILPTEYTFGLLDILRVLLDFIITVGVFIFWLIGVLLAWPLSLLGVHMNTDRPQLPPAAPTPVAEQPPPAGLDPFWTDLAQSALFWAVVIAVAVYALRVYLSQHPQVRAALRRLRLMQALRAWGAALRRWLRGYPAAIGASVRGALARRPARLAPPARIGLTRAGKLSPREQVYQYYLGVLHRAGREGFPRRPAQTPHEYENALAPAVPQAAPDLDGITRAFIEARYSPHPIDPVQAEQAYRYGKGVEAALDARAQPPAAPDTSRPTWTAN